MFFSALAWSAVSPRRFVVATPFVSSIGPRTLGAGCRPTSMPLQPPITCPLWLKRACARGARALLAPHQLAQHPTQRLDGDNGRRRLHLGRRSPRHDRPGACRPHPRRHCLFAVHRRQCGLISVLPHTADRPSQVPREWSRVDSDLCCAYRVLKYESIPQEAPSESGPDDCPPEWPARGEVEFRNVSLRYRNELPLVLRNVSFSIRAGEKVRVAVKWRKGSLT